jgi:hypothetical protein
MNYHLDMQNRLEKQPEHITGSQLINVLNNNLDAQFTLDEKIEKFLLGFLKFLFIFCKIYMKLSFNYH